MNQFLVRVVNIYDFMILNLCKNVLKLKEDFLVNVIVDSVVENRFSIFVIFFDEGILGYRIYFVIVFVEFLIDDYVKFSKEELGFIEIDLVMVRIIYEVVEEKGEFGVIVKELQVCFIIYSIIVFQLIN